MTPLVAVVSAIFGLAVGSFLNVVIWRVPRHESVVAPASHCPACDAPIRPFDNVPVASWVLLRGRCRDCGSPISARYPVVEAATAALFAAIGARFASAPWALPAYLVLGAALFAISVIDLEHYIVPNRIVYPVGAAGFPLLAIASAGTGDWGALGRAALGAVAAFVPFLLMHLAYPRGMGFGDVRLSFVLGLFLGWLGWPELALGLFAGFVYGSVVGVALQVLGVVQRKQAVPFGPFLAAGAMTIVLVGGPIVSWYTHLGA